VLLNGPLGYGETIDEFVERGEALGDISSDDIAEFVRVNLPADQYIEIRVMPR